MSAGELLEEVLEAHGGRERWEAAGRISAHVRTGGLLLTTRAPRRMYPDYRCTVRLREPRVDFRLALIEQDASFDSGRVRLDTRDGELIAKRDDPRPLFFGRAGLRRNLRWDPLDLTYFAGYALWNYLTTPLLLARDEIELSEGEEWAAPGGETWRRLDARFGPELHTHCEHQTFWVDPGGLLRRHDYTADVIGPWAKAAHTLAEHREYDGLVFPTRRRVTARGPGNRSLPGPTLVRLELDRIEVSEE